MTQTPHRQRFLLRHPAQTQGFREPLEQEPLENAIALTMLWIPPGRFWMGSPAQEPDREDDEGPLHLVQLEGFFMGQAPITQAQWREVAGWQPRDGESWGRELQLNPSYFHAGYGEKGGNARLLAGELNTDQRPVEQVSWEDAIEFCNRLSQRTGRHYSLPSEARSWLITMEIFVTPMAPVVSIVSRPHRWMCCQVVILLSKLSLLMLGACWICMAMCGSGASINGIRTTREPRKMGVPG